MIINYNYVAFCIFLDEGIDQQAFLYMSEYMVKELIPTIGKRFHFLENRKRLLTFEKEDSVRSVR